MAVEVMCDREHSRNDIGLQLWPLTISMSWTSIARPATLSKPGSAPLRREATALPAHEGSRFLERPSIFPLRRRSASDPASSTTLLLVAHAHCPPLRQAVAAQALVPGHEGFPTKRLLQAELWCAHDGRRATVGRFAGYGSAQPISPFAQSRPSTPRPSMSSSPYWV